MMISSDELDVEKIDQAALALLYLTRHDGNRAWKGLDWDIFYRLHAAGWIEDSRNKNKSIVFTGEGLERAEQLLRQHFLRLPKA